MSKVTIDHFSPVDWDEPELAFAALIWNRLPYLGDEEPILVMESDDIDALFDCATQRKKAVLLEFVSRDDLFPPEQWLRQKTKVYSGKTVSFWEFCEESYGKHSELRKFLKVKKMHDNSDESPAIGKGEIGNNILRALNGKPHEAMSLEQVMEAMATGGSYVAEPGYMEEIIRLARLGQTIENMKDCHHQPALGFFVIAM